MTERVLVFNETEFDLTKFDKFGGEQVVTDWIYDVYLAQKCHYQFRSDAEDNPNWKQVIPYVIIYGKNGIFGYKRTAGDKRLTGKASVGFGGHVNDIDNGDYMLCAERELKEETGLVSDNLTHKGVIYDPSNDVGRVHFGIVLAYRVDADNPDMWPRAAENSLKEIEYAPKEKWLAEPNLETWSRLVLENVCF